METFDVSALAVNRLDFVTALLAVIALLFALGVFPLFAFLRYRAEKVAREAVKEEIEAFMLNLEKVAISRIESLLPELIREYMPFIKDNPDSVDDHLANEIAEAEEVKTDVSDTRNPKSTGKRPGRRPRSGPQSGSTGS